ncbi:hypothetical protein MPL3356_60363 [Mesorhizobium plurifarium]|uniref:Uncharacterized protein n=1 Tax=Mesorhizobium plurifarium TaxID=69974 RepID=A0A090G5W0_MESPL|nr:hypothetical protein MPL3356_60363 [Mesorhizobium plurifarium]
MPKAAATRTKSAAVGLVVPRSMTLSIAFETSERSANSARDQPLIVLSERMRLPIVAVISFDISSIRPIYRNSENREEAVRSNCRGWLNAAYTIRPHVTLTPIG